jgi:hypothetical protein
VVVGPYHFVGVLLVADLSAMEAIMLPSLVTLTWLPILGVMSRISDAAVLSVELVLRDMAVFLPESIAKMQLFCSAKCKILMPGMGVDQSFASSLRQEGPGIERR